MGARKNARERRRHASLPRVRPFFLALIYFLAAATQARSLYVSGKLPTYPSSKSSLTLTFHLGQNAGSGDGVSLRSMVVLVGRANKPRWGQ